MIEIFFYIIALLKKQSCLLNRAGINLEQYEYLIYLEETYLFNFLFIGRVMKEKGIDELFDAMKVLVKDGYRCRLNIVGMCEEIYEQMM